MGFWSMGCDVKGHDPHHSTCLCRLLLPRTFFLLPRLYLTPWCIARTRFFMSWASCMYVEVQIFLRLPNRFHALLNWMITISYIVYHINGLIWSSISSWGDGKRERGGLQEENRVDQVAHWHGRQNLLLLDTCLYYRMRSCVLLGWHCCFFSNFHLSPILSFLNIN